MCFFDKNTLEGLTATSRGGVLDLFCRDARGRRFIVEMQLRWYPDLVQRLKFYAFHKMDAEIRKGIGGFEALPQIYCIAVLGFNLFPGERYRTAACLRTDAGDVIDEQLSFVFVELDLHLVQVVRREME